MQTTALLGEAGGRQSKKRLQVETEALSKDLTLVRGLDFTLRAPVGRAGFHQPSGEQALQSRGLRMMTLLLSMCLLPYQCCFLVCQVGTATAPQAHRV